MVLGGTSYLAPSAAARAFAIDPEESQAMPSAIRLFGARELVLGVGILGGRQDRRWLTLGTIADCLDLLTVALGLRARRLRTATVVIGGSLALVAVGLGLTARRE